MTLRIAATAAVCLCATAAAAEEWLPPGFYAFPAEPAMSEAFLAESCASGLTVSFGGGQWLSLMTPVTGVGRPFVDAEASCTAAGDGVETCAIRLLDPMGGGEELTTTTNRYSRDGAGHLVIAVEVDGQDGQIVSYPQPCPGEAARDLLRAALGL